MTNFSTIGVPDFLNQSLAAMNITTPTPVQEQAIPLAMTGKNVLASAQTGTGKTIAYAIPMISQLMESPTDSALILVPTRELAVQVRDGIQKILGPKNSIKCALLIGGDSMLKQFAQLKAKPRIIIGTPGRIYDHLRRKSLSLKETRFFVLDETDRMLDMGFSIQLDEIVPYLPEQKQTLMFSATLPKSIMRLAEKYLGEYDRVSIDMVTKASDNIKQEVIKLKASEKYDSLLQQLDTRDGSVIVFVKTKRNADQLTEKLRDENHQVHAFHGDLRQRKRETVIKDFRNQRKRILVCTDIAARGLDIPHVKHVINYDLPQCPEDYIHRIGRTGRAGAEGHSLCLVSPEDNRKWQVIYDMMNPEEAKSRVANRSRATDSAPSKKRRAGNGFGKSFDRPSRSAFSSDRPKRDFSEKSDRPSRGAFSSDRPKRDFSEKSDRPSRGAFSSDRPKRDFSEKSDRPSRGAFSSDRPKRDFSEKSDRPSRGAFSSDRPKKDFSERSGRLTLAGFSSDRSKKDFFGEDKPAKRTSAPKAAKSFSVDKSKKKRSNGKPKKF